MAGASDEVGWLGHNLPARLPAGDVLAGWLGIENRGTRTWHPGSFRVAIEVDGAAGLWAELAHAVAPGERATLHWVFRVPGALGNHEIAFRLVAPEGPQARPWRVKAEAVMRPVTATGRLRDRVLETHARTWLVADGASGHGAGPLYPQFARSARGCRITDIEGREYVDYMMGWGAALLGYAHERIQTAMAGALGSGAITTLTHRLMPELADALCATLSGAEAATFGKNGSDVCTAAVRMARVHTGRPIVLYCGYHGWQDWYAERMGFAASGVPAPSEPHLLPFPPNDLDSVERLFRAHRGQVAAVMLEPAGVLESTNGPVRDADASFLRELAALARREGALLVFDEILTGFRHRSGSVQRATGVVPDLTCLGKALGGGMPLSALVGRRSVFDSAIGRIYYEPTFKGEAYSFAAALEALAIFREQDVPAAVAGFGERLRRLVDGLMQATGIEGCLAGPPYRMLLTFGEANPRRRTLMRTLVHQELMRQGVLTTQNLFLPSLAHDDAALEQTRQAFEHSLRVLSQALDGDRFVSFLEIPPLPG